MPNMSNPAYANTVASNIEGAKNRLAAANIVIANINASIAYPQNLDANTMTTYNAELIAYQAKVTGIQAEITALNAIT
jgi:ABC-type transport system substrate-binding protein